MPAYETTTTPPTRADPGVSLAESADALCQPPGATCAIDAERVARARAALPTEAHVATLAETLRALGDPTRLRIARALAAEELCVCDLALLLGLAQPTVSHSLRTLRQLRLVRYRRAGKVAYYSLDDAHVRQIVETGFAHVAEPGDARVES